MTLRKSRGGGGRYNESARTAEELKSVTVQRVFKVFALFSSPAWQVWRGEGQGRNYWRARSTRGRERAPTSFLSRSAPATRALRLRILPLSTQATVLSTHRLDS